jgi:MFS family permease
MIRSLAMNLAGIFLPIYLYQLGYPIWQIMFMYALLFSAALLFTYPTARLVARFGPKHTILLSFVLQVMALVYFSMLSSVHLPAVGAALLFGAGSTLFFTAFHVDFSKVKHADHAGKEVGWLYTMEKTGGILGPIVGGVIGFVFGGEYIFAAAMVLMLIAAAPLFLTHEPVKTRQKLDFKGVHVKDIKHDLGSYAALALENSISNIVWPFFVGVIIFTQNPYILLGSITSAAVVVSIITARGVGRMVDNRKGRVLLRYGVSANALLHVFRCFTNGYVSALSINLVNEAVTVSYRMPYMKGMYNAADDHPGFRIVYIAALETAGYAIRSVFFAIAALAAYFFSDGRLLFAGLFLVGGVASLMIMTERYRALSLRQKYE